MIYITKINDQEVLLNNDLIEKVEETPDTVITLTTGKKMVVKQTVEEIYEKVLNAKREIFR